MAFFFTFSVPAQLSAPASAVALGLVEMGIGELSRPAADRTLANGWAISFRKTLFLGRCSCVGIEAGLLLTYAKVTGRGASSDGAGEKRSQLEMGFSSAIGTATECPGPPATCDAQCGWSDSSVHVSAVAVFF